MSVVEVEGRPLCIFISELTFKLYEQHMQIFSVINAINSIALDMVLDKSQWTPVSLTVLK